jgi:hypothetical protein
MPKKVQTVACITHELQMSARIRKRNQASSMCHQGLNAIIIGVKQLG